MCAFQEDIKTINEDINTICDKLDQLERRDDLAKIKGITLERPKPEPKEIPPNIALLFLIKDKIHHLQQCFEIADDKMKQKLCDKQLPIIYGLLKHALGLEEWNQFYNAFLFREDEFTNIVRHLNGKIDDICEQQRISIPIPKLRF